MSIQIFGTRKCKSTQKAIRFFKERRIQFQFVDLTEKSVSPGELSSISQSITLEELIDTEGKQFQKRNLGYMKFDIENELLEDPLLLKTPIIRSKGKAVVGYEPEKWKEFVEA